MQALMKQVGLTAGSLALALLAGCKSTPMPPMAAAPEAPRTVVELIPFQIGVSSVTVEKLARQQACTGGQGAGLITDKGPVEVYRMQCDGGKTFLAKCDLRQCQAMQR